MEMNEYGEPILPDDLPASPPPLEDVVAQPERRARSGSSWANTKLLGIIIVAALAVGFAGWFLTNLRADSLTDAVCAMADTYRDDEKEDRRVADALEDLGDELNGLAQQLSAGITTLLVDDEEAIENLRTVVRDQAAAAEARAKEAREAAERPPLPEKVAEVCD